MNTDYRYQLDSPRVTGRRQEKVTCPRCGRRRCLVRYVDTHDQCQYLNDEVGRCDHEQSCGYHYRPSDYFRDHPWLGNSDRAMSRQPSTTWKRPAPPPPAPLCPLPAELVGRYHSPQSIFWQWFAGPCARQLGLKSDAVRRVYERYHIGATQASYVVFWQIDEQGRVRTGQIMQYHPDGHRHGYQNWIHAILASQKQLPQGFQLRQCLFGQHLLPQFPDHHVCLVESQKTALIMSALHPEHLWLATCGSGGLNAEKVECLRGRRFTLFPDSGCYAKWQKAMAETEGLTFNIDQSLESYPSNTDLADLLFEPP